MLETRRYPVNCAITFVSYALTSLFVLTTLSVNFYLMRKISRDVLTRLEITTIREVLFGKSKYTFLPSWNAHLGSNGMILRL